MNINEASNFLKKYGAHISDNGIRQAARRGKIHGVEQDEITKTYSFSKNGLIEFLIKGQYMTTVDSYNLGYESALQDLDNQVIEFQHSNRNTRTFLFSSLFDNTYHYVVSNFWHGYNYFYIKYDSEKNIFHILDNLETSGTSATNLVDPLFISDLLRKIGSDYEDTAIEKVVLLIYTNASEKNYSNISNYAFDPKKNNFEFNTLRNFNEEHADPDFVKMVNG